MGFRVGIVRTCRLWRAMCDRHAAAFPCFFSTTMVGCGPWRRHLKNNNGTARALGASQCRATWNSPWRADGTSWAWVGLQTAAMSTSSLPGLEQSPWPRLVGEGWVGNEHLTIGTLVAARKSDDSLWVSQELEALCAWIIWAVALQIWHLRTMESHGVHLLALRTDGTLLDYHASDQTAA